MEEKINEILEEIEQREHVQIFMAALIGSRAWGAPGPDSDYDVRFLYFRAPEEYLTLKPQKEVIEEKGEELDIEGWDLRKALKLLRDGNPTLYEWFESPVRYRDTPEARVIQAILPKVFDPRKFLHCYFGMANQVNKTYLQGEMVEAKRYLHALWCVLICRWILDKGTPPLLYYDTLIKKVLDPDLLALVQGMRWRRQFPKFDQVIPRMERVNDYLDDQINIIPDEFRARTWNGVEKLSWEFLDHIFLKIILRQTEQND